MSLPDHIRKAIDHYIPPMEGWLDAARGHEMAELIIDTKPEVVLELGVFGGRSLVCQAFAIRENNKGKIYGIDPWKVETAVEHSQDEKNNEWWRKNITLEDIHRGCMRAIWDHHLDPWVVIIRAASQHVYQLFPNNMDILYVDSNHSEISSCRDVENFVPRVKQGGHIWFDDADWATTQKALGIIGTMCDLVKDNGNYRLYRKR